MYQIVANDYLENNEGGDEEISFSMVCILAKFYIRKDSYYICK